MLDLSERSEPCSFEGMSAMKFTEEPSFLSPRKWSGSE